MQQVETFSHSVMSLRWTWKKHQHTVPEARAWSSREAENTGAGKGRPRKERRSLGTKTKEKVRVEAQPDEPTEQERNMKQLTFRLHIGVRVVSKPRVNRIMKRRTLKLERIL